MKLVEALDEVATEIELRPDHGDFWDHVEAVEKAARTALGYFTAKRAECPQCLGDLGAACTCRENEEKRIETEAEFWKLVTGCVCPLQARTPVPECKAHQRVTGTEGLQGLAEEALAAMDKRRGEDVEEWAKVLAENTSHLTD